MGNLLSGDFTRLTFSGEAKAPCHLITHPLFSDPPASVSREVRHAR